MCSLGIVTLRLKIGYEITHDFKCKLCMLSTGKNKLSGNIYEKGLIQDVNFRLHFFKIENSYF
jgi:hypothetical protein